jgi:hypothetical protein
MKPQSHMIERAPAHGGFASVKPMPARARLSAHWELRNGRLARSFELAAG